MSQLDVQWRALGQHFGYPQCCVNAFLANCCQVTKDRYPKGPWVGTGYIPCPDCAEKAVENFDDFVATVIAPVRTANAPFPEEGCEDAIDAAVYTAWQNVPNALKLWYQVTERLGELGLRAFQP